MDMDPIITTSPVAILGTLGGVAHQPGDHGNEFVQPLAAAQLAARIGKHLVDFPSHTRPPIRHSIVTQTLWHRQLLDSPKKSAKGLAKLATPG